MKLTDVSAKKEPKTAKQAAPVAKDDDFEVFDDPKPAPAPQPGRTYTQTMDDLHATYDGHRCSIDDVETIANQTISALPRLDPEAIRDELEQMNVAVYEEPTTDQLARGMAEVQAYKDRVGAIANQVEREYMVRKRTLDMLFDANQAVSAASSADKRKGEAQLRWPMMQMDLVNIEVLRLEVNTVGNNLKSKGDMLSRQASILQMQIQLGEYRQSIPKEYGETRPDNVSSVREVGWENI